ncbi:MAG TPA: hypothetical protein DDZ78_03745 [Porphyromonadaceae bacterium]|nr:hypothetical protein [Porphyromonadaceae bacterium]
MRFVRKDTSFSVKTRNVLQEKILKWRLKRITNYELRITNYELRITTEAKGLKTEDRQPVTYPIGKK